MTQHPILNAPQGSKLQIGSGGKDISGYVNTDVRLESSPAGFTFDPVADPMPSGRFSSIYLCHIWEHIYSDQAPALLRKFRQALAPGGTLRISVPDLRKILRGCVETPPGHPDHFGTNLNAPLFGPCLSTTPVWDTHKRAFTIETLTAELQAAGFTDIRRWHPSEVPAILAVRDWSSFDTISLNLVAAA